MSGDKYVPAIGDRVRIVDADWTSDRGELVGTVTALNGRDVYREGDVARLHPIAVREDDGDYWHAVEVELIETAAEIAEYEEACREHDEEAAYWRDIDEMADVIAAKGRGWPRLVEAMETNCVPQRFIVGVDPDEMTADDAQDLIVSREATKDDAREWPDDRTPEQVAESDRAIEALRVKFGTDEVRITSATGGSKGSKIARFDLIPTGPLWELAEHYGKGAQKYKRVNGKDNWRNGYDWSLSYAALQRHANAFWNGEDIDPENGSKHIIAAAWHCLALAHFMGDETLREMFDDRQEGV